MSKNVATMTTVNVATSSGTYPVCIGAGAWRVSTQHPTEAALAALQQASQILVVTNERVGPLHLEAVLGRLNTLNAHVGSVVLPDGEQHKSLGGLEPIYRALLERQADRKTLLVALGGGVIGDMTGFAAATYMRGIDFVQMPTTLLAQVDSSVGGKTGVNHALGKNMIGAFHQPKAVWCDFDWLATLPQREYASGLAEVIKYGPIYDWDFFNWLEDHIEALVAREPAALTHAVKRSVEIKAAVVGEDERESGLRAILNFGHTFGHAIEAGLGYGSWLHGEAVAAGMVMASALSVRLGHLQAATHERLMRLIAKAGLPTRGPDLGADAYLGWMRVDKKASQGSIRYVLIGDGQPAMLERVADAQALEAIEQCVDSANRGRANS